MKSIFHYSLFAVLVGLSLLRTTIAADRPNIILIISDDHGYGDYGFMGSKVAQTPNIDRIASQSQLYPRGYVMPVCSPSLACLLTGRMPHENGITGNDLVAATQAKGKAKASRSPLAQQLLSNPIILPKVLSDSGYLTFQSGKLWNTTYREVGFTHGMTDTAGRHGDAGLDIGRKGMKPMFDFMDKAQKQDKPFFVWYAPFMPHTPHNPPADLLAKYQNRGLTPAAEKYFAMVEWFDQTCGELDRYLADHQLSQNTAVLYLADNGWDASYGNSRGRAKLSPYELGIRTPMFVRWPGKVAPQRDDESLASIVDFVPTILKIAGIQTPHKLPGLDLTDGKAMSERKSIFVEAYTHDIADLSMPEKSLIAKVVLNGWSKLLIPGSATPDKSFNTKPSEIELFDLKSDPLEAKNIASQYPERVKQLMAIQEAAWKAP